MTGQIRHVHTNAVADGTATSVVRPSDWNSIHAYTLQDGVSLGGNTAGVLAAISAGTLLLAGGNNITLSQDANSVTVSAANAPAQTAYLFSNSNGVSFGTAGSTVTATVATNYQSAGAYLTTAMLSNAVTLSNVRVSAGTTSNLLSAFTLSNSNGISFGLDGSTLTASHNALTSQSAQALSAANGSFTFQTATFSNANGISFGTSAGSAITASHNALTTQSNQTLAMFATSNTTQSSSGTADARSLTFAGAGVASVGVTGGSVVISVPSGGGGITNINLSAGTTSQNLSAFVLSNSNNVSFGLNGSTVTATVASSLTAVRVSGGTTSNLLSALTFADSNGVSFGLNASTLTATVKTDYLTSQSNQNVTAANGGFAFQTLSFSNANAFSFGTSAGSAITGSYTVPTVTNSSMTVSDAATSGTLARLAFTNLNGVTLSLSSGAGGSHTIVGSHNALTSQSNQNVTAGNGGFAFQTLSFSNLNGISFGTSAGSAITASHNAITSQTNQQMTMFATGNTTQSSTGTSNASSLIFRGEGIASVGITGGSVVVSVPAGAPSPVNFSAGTTSGNLGSVVFSNSNNVSFGLNGSTITATATVATSLTNINVSAGTTSSNLSAMVFSNSNGVSFGLNGATITASGGGGGVVNRQYHEIMDGENLVTVAGITGASYSKRPIFVPFWMDGEGLSVKSVDFYASRPAGTSLNMTYGIGFYSMSNSTRLDLVSSTTNAVSLTTSAQFSGIRRYQITGLSAMTLSEGRWIAALYFVGSNNSTEVANLALYGGQTMIGVNGYVHPGTNSTGATSGSEHVVPFWGVYASTTAAYPASVHRSQISGQGSNNVNADVYMVIREI